MKKVVLLLIGLLFFSGVFAQVNFRNMTLEEALKVAEKEGKKVFVDFTAPWCCGCKLIESELKKAKEFGQVMNTLFVCIQADVDTEYGRKLRDQYVVPSLPTYLFIRPDGTVQHQFGGGSSIEYFVKKFWRGIDPYHNYLYYKTQYDAGKRDFNFLVEYVECLEEMGWDQVKEQVKEEAWNKASDQLKISNFSLFFDKYLDEDSKEFQFLLTNQEACKAACGSTRVNGILLAPLERQLKQIIKRDTVWSKSDLNGLKKKIAERGGASKKELNFQLELCHAICSGKESQLVEICEKGLSQLPNEHEIFSTLYYCADPVQDPTLVKAWIEVCKKQLPNMTDHFIIGRKKGLESLIEQLEEKL